MRTTARRALFLDRDGTLIVDQGYPSRPEQIRLLPGAAEALALLARQGFVLVVVSNQSGVGRGFLTREQAERVHERLVECLAAHGVQLDASYYCYHAPWEGCCCRKPSPEMLRRAAEQLDLDLTRSFLIGDKPRDVEAGRAAGCRTIFLAMGPAADGGAVPFEGVATNWDSVVEQILSQTKGTL
jgi:histidinol-phosphate phosphatase family protein